MEQRILQALRNIHSKYEQQSELKIPYLPVSLRSILEEMGLEPAGIYKGFYEALESLDASGYISDLSTSNGGFGRNIGTDGDIAYSNGAKVILV